MTGKGDTVTVDARADGAFKNLESQQGIVTTPVIITPYVINRFLGGGGLGY